MRFAISWSLRVLVLGCLLSVAVPMPASAQPKVVQHRYYHYYHALWELRDARQDVIGSKNVWGEQKEKAVIVITDAIKQTGVYPKKPGI